MEHYGRCGVTRLREGKREIGTGNEVDNAEEI